MISIRPFHPIEKELDQNRQKRVEIYQHWQLSIELSEDGTRTLTQRLNWHHETLDCPFCPSDSLVSIWKETTLGFQQITGRCLGNPCTPISITRSATHSVSSGVSSLGSINGWDEGRVEYILQFRLQCGFHKGSLMCQRKVSKCPVLNIYKNPRKNNNKKMHSSSFFWKKYS